MVLRVVRGRLESLRCSTRVCIGNSFAMMESVLVLATIARRFHLALTPGARVVPLPTMTLRPEFGLEVAVSERVAAPR